MIFLLFSVTVLIAVVAVYLQRIYSRFSRYGVKHFRPVPFIGNMTRPLFRLDHFTDDFMKLYDRFPEERFVGRYEFLSETVMIRDIELVKKVAVKDLDHFIDHRPNFGPSNSFFSRNLFSLKAGYIDIECKDLTTRYTNDVIASCAFGLKVDSHNDENNEFNNMGKMTSDFNFRQMLLILLTTNAPSVAKILNIDFLSDLTKKFFRKLVLETMGDREKRNIIRPDMIHLLMEAKKGKLTHEGGKIKDEAAGFATVEESSVGRKESNTVWTDDDLVAQAVLFFIAGFETVSSGMSFMLYELALNPDVQERLAQAIKEIDAKNGGKFDFNSIQNKPYMDMVVSEVLRKWPPAVVLDRICTKDYNLGKPNEKAEKDFIIRKGSGLWIPVLAFHRDPQCFPDPEKFDPERFSEENKHKIQSTYMPFGIGPRNCIGSRFALYEMKVIAYQILLQIEVSPCGSGSELGRRRALVKHSFKP